VKSPDAEARELARILIDAARSENDSGHGMMVPGSVMRQLRIVSTGIPVPMTLDEARRRLDIPLVIFEQELRHFLFVREIIAGTRKTHRRSS
jgi:CO dehydrogenase/acetyl-CoA synthase alpha subunit